MTTKFEIFGYMALCTKTYINFSFTGEGIRSGENLDQVCGSEFRVMGPQFEILVQETGETTA
jgi:hypothetical protein